MITADALALEGGIYEDLDLVVAAGLTQLEGLFEATGDDGETYDPALFLELSMEGAKDAIVSGIRRFIDWIRQTLRAIWEKLGQLWERLGLTVTARVNRAQRAPAAGFDDAEVAAAKHGINLQGTMHAARGKTCREVCLSAGWVEKHGTSQEVYATPGAGRALQGVQALEQLYVEHAMKVAQEVVTSAETYGLKKGGHADAELNEKVMRLLGAHESNGGYSANEVGATGRYDRWYAGRVFELPMNAGNYKKCEELFDKVQHEMKELTSNKPGERVAALLSRFELQVIKSGIELTSEGKKRVMTMLRTSGNGVVHFHNGLARGMMESFRAVSAFLLRCLRSVAADPVDGRDPGSVHEAPQLAHQEAADTWLEEAVCLYDPTILTEGLGTMVKNLATGDIDKEVAELQKEAKDVHTPEQQRIVLMKLIRVLEKLVRLRHGGPALARYVHDSIGWFQKVMGTGNAPKELNTRLGEAIGKLAKVRDQLLSKNWGDDVAQRQADELRQRAEAILRNAAAGKDSDF